MNDARRDADESAPSFSSATSWRWAGAVGLTMTVAAVVAFLATRTGFVERLVLRFGGRLLTGAGRRAPGILAVFGVVLLLAWAVIAAVGAIEGGRSSRPETARPKASDAEDS